MPTKPPDPIDRAIGAVQAPAPIEMANVSLKIMGKDDRPAAISIPKDVTDVELLALVAAILHIGDQLRPMRGPQLQVVRAMPNGQMS